MQLVKQMKSDVVMKTLVKVNSKTSEQRQLGVYILIREDICLVKLLQV